MSLHVRSCLYIVFLSHLLLLSTIVGASEEVELITDRPDFTESPCVVPTGSIQLESGVTWQEHDDLEQISGLEALVRWGFSRNLELRFGLPDYTEVLHGAEPGGWEDASIGLKWEIGKASRWDFALIAEASVPTGSDLRTSDAVDPGLILITGTDLSDDWSLGAQLEAGNSTIDDGRIDVFGGTLVLGLGVNKQVGTFFEVKAEKEKGTDTAVVFHHGWVYLLTPSLQFDFHLGAGLSDTAPDWLVGLGLSMRFDQPVPTRKGGNAVPEANR